MELNMLKSALIENKVTIQINENPKFVQSINADPMRINTFDKIPRVGPPCREAVQPVVNIAVIPDIPVKTPTFLIMQLIDPKFEILSSKDQEKEIFIFKEQMCKNLDNHMQFYKKLGFSRKKSITLDSLKKQIMDGDTTPEIMLYFANLVQKNIVVITIPTLDREDYSMLSSMPSILLLKHENTYELFEDGATEAKLKELYNKDKDIKDMKITELRHLVKLFKIEKASTKVDMQNALGKIFT